MKPVVQNNTTTSYHKLPYRTEIDGLRAFAVIAVIIGHFSKDILPGGYLGVDIFFVISGYVITSSLAGRCYRNFGELLLDFYTRRIKRLVPALVLFTVITSIFVCVFVSDNAISLRTGVASLFGLSNLYLLKQASDYFGTSSELNVFTHTWSLGVEEQFYFIFPLIVWFSGFGRHISNGARNLFLVMVVLSTASLIAFVYFSQTNQPVAYFLMPTRLWELGAGCLLFLGSMHRDRLFGLEKNIQPLLVIVIIVGVLFVPNQFTVPATITVVALTTILISCLRPETLGYDLFKSQQLVFIGKISYSLYLWHWGVISLSRWTIGIHWWSIPFQVTLMLILATASYRYVETPLRHAEWSCFRWKSIGYGVGALIISALALVFLLSSGKNLLYSGATSSKPESILLVNDTSKESINNKEGTILLIGDSHAMHFNGLIKSVADKFYMNYKSVSEGATPFPTVNISTPVGGLTFTRNQKNNNKLLLKLKKELKTIQPETGDIIVLSSFYQFYFGKLSGSMQYRVLTHYNDNGNVITQQESLQNWLKNLKDFASEYNNVNIVLLLSTPEMPDIYPDQVCKKEWFRRSISEKCHVSILYSKVVDELSRLNLIISQKASESTNILVFDPTPSLCGLKDEYCQSHRDGNRLFSDEHHLTEYGAEQVKNDFIEFLVKNKLLKHLSND